MTPPEIESRCLGLLVNTSHFGQWAGFIYPSTLQYKNSKIDANVAVLK